MPSIVQILFKLKTQLRELARVAQRRLRPNKHIRILFNELLDQTQNTLSLDELLVLVPRKLSLGLGLCFVTIFLREATQYIAQHGSGESAESILGFPINGSTVAHLRRDHVTVLVNFAKPDTWLLLANVEELRTLEQVHAQLLVPLQGRTGMAGFMAVAKDPGKKFSSFERRSLQSLGVHIGIGFETARFIETLREQAVTRTKLKKELELAREVQERLLPQILPAISQLDVAAHYQSAEEIGGDYYDAFERPDGLVCYIIADVSGKGISSALLMATLRASLRSILSQNCDSASALVASLNNLLFDASSPSRFATLFLMLYAPGEDRAIYVNAGHNPPLLISNGYIKRLECGGPVAGLLKGVEYECDIVPFSKGDCIIAYTDGVTEAVNPEGEEWGEKPLADLALASAGETASNIIAIIVRALTNFTAGAVQRDDITMLVLRRY